MANRHMKKVSAFVIRKTKMKTVRDNLMQLIIAYIKNNQKEPVLIEI